MRLADECRHKRYGQQRDQPRCVDDQSRAEADDGDHVLDLPEQLADQRHSSRRLAPRPIEPVLQFAVLEIFQVERRRVLHQAQAGGVAELLGQQRIEQRNRTAEDVGRNCEGEFQQQQSADAIEQPGGVPLRERARRRRAGQQDDLVDDQLADVKRGDREQGSRESQDAFADRECRARLPDQLDERRQVAQRADAFTQRARAGGLRLPRNGSLGCASSHRVVLWHRAAGEIRRRPARSPEPTPCYDNCRTAQRTTTHCTHVRCRNQSYAESSFRLLRGQPSRERMQPRPTRNSDATTPTQRGARARGIQPTTERGDLR